MPKANPKPVPAPQDAANAVALAPVGGAVALPPDLAAALAGAAKDAAAKERPKVGRISLKSGVMSYNGGDIDDNNMDVVIVGATHRHVFYSGPYDENNVANPDCFALAEDEEDMAPHENVTNPVNATCKGCANLEWGSAGGGRKGKACKQTRRLVLMPTSALSSVDDVLAAELAILDVPVTSVGNYGNLVNTVAATTSLPVWAVVTNVKVRPHKRNQFEVVFAPMKTINDEHLLRAIMKRRDDALRIALVPYDGTGGENDPAAVKGNAPKVNKGKF